jgi:hypothetical protein
MPILSSLGALEFPRTTTISTPFPTGNGFISLTQPATGNIQLFSQYNGCSVGADSSGYMYTTGTVPGTGFPIASPPDAYMIILNNNGGASADGVAFTGLCFGAAVTTNNKVYFAGRKQFAVGSTTNYSGVVQNTSGGGTSSRYNGPVQIGQTQPFGTFNTDFSGNVFYTYTNLNVCFGYCPTTTKRVSMTFGGGSSAKSVSMSNDANGNNYLMAYGNANQSINYITKWNSSNVKQWTIAINTITLSMVSDINYVYVTTNDGAIIQLNASNGSIVRQFYINGVVSNRYLSMGDNGYLYVTGYATGIASFDSSGNILWANGMAFYGDPSGGGGTDLGITQKNGYVYVTSTASYNGRSAIFNYKVPDDGSIPAPGGWWLGTKGFVTYNLVATTKTSSSYTSTTATITNSSTTAILSTDTLGSPVGGGNTTGAPI